MNKELEEVMGVVEEINELLFDAGFTNGQYYLRADSTGWESNIYLDENMIWSSEDSEYAYADSEQEEPFPIKEQVLRALKDRAKKLNKIVEVLGEDE